MLSARANDVSYDVAFAKQVRTFAQADDIVIAISASGNSPDVLAAVAAAREMGARVIGVRGFSGVRPAPLCDVALVVPSREYGPVDELHMVLLHAVTASIRERLEAGPAPIVPLSPVDVDGLSAAVH
jgi:D-sedoheptulose 7-phosphate isomerase